MLEGNSKNKEGLGGSRLALPLIALTGLTLCSLLAFNATVIEELKKRDPTCQITHTREKELDAVHLFHGKKRLGNRDYYPDVENGFMGTYEVHGYMHWLQARLGISPLFGLTDKDCIGSADSCFKKIPEAAAMLKEKPDLSPYAFMNLTEDHKIKVLLFITSWLNGLQAIYFNNKGQTLQFDNGLTQEYLSPTWTEEMGINRETINKNSQGVRPVEILGFRRLLMKERMTEISKVLRQLIPEERKFILETYLSEGSFDGKEVSVIPLIELYEKKRNELIVQARALGHNKKKLARNKSNSQFRNSLTTQPI